MSELPSPEELPPDRDFLADDGRPGGEFWLQLVLACLVAVSGATLIAWEMGGIGVEHRSGVDYFFAGLLLLTGAWAFVRGILARSIIVVCAGLFIAALGALAALGVRQCQGDECGGDMLMLPMSLEALFPRVR